MQITLSRVPRNRRPPTGDGFQFENQFNRTLSFALVTVDDNC